MPTESYAPIFALTRGGIVESIHYGSVAIVAADGKLIASHGDPQVVTFLRSSAKPFQAMPFVQSGGPQAFHLTQKEVAILCASHSGTDEHAATVAGIQAKTGVSESDLLCGTHTPYHLETAEALRARGEAPTPNRHNCSGKHTGMLAYVHYKEIQHTLPENDLAYIDPQHPVQKEILKNFAGMCGLDESDVVVGIDGCSAPNFAVPLYNAAWAFARLCDPSGLDPQKEAACRTITAAMTAFPNMVGGPDSFDTHLMEATQGRLVVKGGAEGYQAVGVMPGALWEGSPALGITLKISDGDLGGHSQPQGSVFGHARPAVTLAILQQLGALTDEALQSLGDYGPCFSLHNWQKIEVGEAYPLVDLGLKDFKGA